MNQISNWSLVLDLTASHPSCLPKGQVVPYNYTSIAAQDCKESH